ncbi:hypothetical protein PsorP6_002004 [Peronosclerospora sorghi]|uniref:Uncharacterized protein n=1 Tax=Peronosclerospora sorghi TaxID=230839 RepID=A0ACC0WSJ6_9STRA|nr:hypothetical protein PsorP6_002004 [Peronosclerospora sorghi]
MSFVAAESEQMYLLAVAKFRELVLGNLRIEDILTDTDLSLKNALTTVYPDVPQMLCIWHVNKNVEKAVADYWKINTSNENNEENKEKRKGFLDTWSSVISQTTEEGFDESYELFKRCYADHPELIDYIENNKYPVRHQFATAFTSKHRHLVHSATSRGENGHRAFKRYLLSSRHDLLKLKDMWTNMLRVFLNGYITELSQRRDRIYHDLNAKRWDDLLDTDINKHVVPRGMKLLVDQFIYAKDDLVYNKSCGGAFTQIYGIPCYHDIRNRMRLSVKITKDDFHPHWNFERPFNGKALGLPEPPLAPPASPSANSFALMRSSALFPFSCAASFFPIHHHANHELSSTEVAEINPRTFYQLGHSAIM